MLAASNADAEVPFKFGNISVRAAELATDGKFSCDLGQNLVGHIEQGPYPVRLLAIEAVGYLRIQAALPTLSNLVEMCLDAGRKNSYSLDIPDGYGRMLAVCSTACEALARLDCREAHKLLVYTCNRSGNRYIREAAISALGIECDWYDPNLIEKYLRGARPGFRVAAVGAIWHSSGPRLLRWKDVLIDLLNDASPWVAIYAVDALALMMHEEDDVMCALLESRSDRRYSSRMRSTVGKYISTWIKDL